MLQKQNKSLFPVKKYEKILSKYFGPRSTWGEALRRKKDNFILEDAFEDNDQICTPKGGLSFL